MAADTTADVAFGSPTACRPSGYCPPGDVPPDATACAPSPDSTAQVAALSFKPAEIRGQLTRIEAPHHLPDGVGEVKKVSEPSSRRRSFIDLTAAPCFRHAPDYRWVSGQVEYSRVRKEWRLRYTSVDETDRYGGRLVLIENEHVGYLSDGQYVRVEGHLVTPSDAPAGTGYYRVEAFRVIDRPNRVPPTAN
jgi:hypothetical protein